MAIERRQHVTESRPLLERRRELQALDEALAALRDTRDGVPQTPRGGLLVFTGPGGMGKTALLAQAHSRALAQGVTVLSGCGGRNEQELAFRVVRRLLQPSLAAMDGDELRAFLGSWYDVVATALGLEAGPGPHVPDPSGVREGLDWVMTRLAARKAPMVLLLDDLHWADVESLDWLTSFAPPGGGPAAADRPRPPARRPAARGGAAARPAGQPRHPRPRAGAAHLRGGGADRQGRGGGRGRGRVLRGMPAGHRGKPVRDRRTRHPPGRTRSAGHPARAARDAGPRRGGQGPRTGRTPARPRDDHRPFRLRRGRARRVRVTGTRRHHRRGRQRGGRRGDGTAARRPDPGRGRRDRGRARLRPPADRHHHLPLHRPGAAGRAAQRGRRGRPGRRVRAGGRRPAPAGGALRRPRRGGGVPARGRPRVHARRRPGSGPAAADAGAPGAAAAGAARRAAARTRLLHLPHQAHATVAHLREALAEPGIDPELRASIVYRLTQALAHIDEVAEAAAVAAEEARRTPHPRIRLRMQADHFVWSSYRTDEPDPAARSRRLARLAAQVTGRGLEERYILGLRAWEAVVCGEPRQTALEYAERALRGGLSWTDENRGFEVPVAVAMVFLYADRPRRAEELFGKGMAECEAKGWRGSHLALGQTLSGYIRYRRGSLAEAENLVREGLRIADRVEGAVPAQWFAVGILIQTLLARGRTAEARRIADHHRYGGLVPNAVIYPDPRTVYAELLLAEGRADEAAALLRAVGDWLDGREWRNPAWCAWQSGLASALVRSAPGRAVRHAQDAVKRARDFGAASAIGQALHTLAEVTGGPASLDLHAEAVGHLEQSPAAYELARALVGHGAALSRTGQLQEAADHLYRGLEGAVHCGAEALAARARDELAAAGLRPLPLRYTQTDTLTAPEREAAELTVRGASTAVIAGKLRLTEQGVRHLLSSVYRKIGTDASGLAAALESSPRPRP